MSEVKTHIRQLADTLKTNLTIGEAGVISAPADLYEKTLPEGVDMSTVSKVYGHTEDLAAALTLATGEMGETALKADKKLESVSSEMKIGKHGTIAAQYARMATRPKSPTDRTPVTHYGVTQTKVTTVAAKNRGELRKVRDSLAERAAKLFG